MRPYNFFILFVLLGYACSDSSRLEQALNLAGDNRGELEKVLLHYHQQEKDSLKYRAACFLIENMPSHYSFISEKFEKIKNEIYPFVLKRDCSPSQAYDSLELKYGRLVESDFRKEPDIEHISAEFLIDNIEWAFKVWEDSKWGKHISFDEFCENILPYRVGNEPLMKWRENYYEIFAPILADSLTDHTDMLQACRFIYNELSKDKWKFENDLHFPSKGANTLLKNRYGNCEDRCELVVYAMRSIGIPCGIDLLLQSPEKGTPHHYWNYIIDEKGRSIDFALGDMIPDTTKQKPHFKIGKTYRRCFVPQLQTPYIHAKLLVSDIPPRLRDINIKDVSKNYFPEEKVVVPLFDNNNTIIYLSVFNNEMWVPIGCVDSVKSDSAWLNYIEPHILYVLGTYKDDVFCLQSLPFIYRGAGKYDLVQADTTQYETIKVDRKYPASERLTFFQKRLIGGEFQGANRRDFKDAKRLYRIDSLPDYKYQNISVDVKDRFEYLRFVSGINGHCEIGDIEFFSTESQIPLTGDIIGEGMSYGNDPEVKREHVFDRDPLTFFSANPPDGAWVGMKLNYPQRINRIRYIGRNDDNNIREGDHYRLQYLLGQDWKLLGERIGREEYLVFDHVPKGALLWLQNITRGKEERVFTYEDGKQVWW